MSHHRDLSILVSFVMSGVAPIYRPQSLLPGKRVRAKSGLNKSLLDQGWFAFRRQWNYKLAWNSGHLIAMPPQNTSRMCPCCGYVAAANRRPQAKFSCVECGYEENADVVGAITIFERGHRLLACGEPVQSGRSMKQAPTEATQAVPPCAP